MQRETKTRVGIAALIYTMTNAVLFGAGIITVLLLPGFSSALMIWIPVVVVASIVLLRPQLGSSLPAFVPAIGGNGYPAVRC